MDFETSAPLEFLVKTAIDSSAAGETSIFLSEPVQKRMLLLREKGASSFALTSLLRSHLLQLAQQRNESTVRQHVGAVYERLLYWMEQVHPLPAGQERARIVHKLVDVAITQASQVATSQQNVSCHKGCSYCCHTQVSITGSEGALIDDFVGQHQIDWDAERAVKQSKMRDPNLYISTLAWNESACVFLDEQGACQIYEARPVSCRKVSVVSDPKLCDPRELNAPSYLIQFDAEIIAAAFYNIEFGRVAWPSSMAAYLSQSKKPV